MQFFASRWLIKPLLAVSLALPAASLANIETADAGKRGKRLAAAALILGGAAILYNERRKRKYRRHYSYVRRPAVPIARHHHHSRRHAHYDRYGRLYTHSHFGSRIAPDQRR